MHQKHPLCPLPLLVFTALLLLISGGIPAALAGQETPGPAGESKPGATKKPATPAKPGGSDPVTRIRQIAGDNFALDEIRFNRATREIRFPAKVNMTENVIEYIIVTEKGKTHESLLSTKTNPFILNVVMLLCRYKPSAEGLIQFVEREGPDAGGGSAPPPGTGKKPEPPKNPFNDSGKPGEKDAEKPAAPGPAPAPAKAKTTDNLLQFFIRYKGKDGDETEILLDDWIFNSITKSSLSDVFWVYTGSDILEGGDFAAEAEGSIVAIYVDRFAMFNNPIKGNDNDDIWEPFTKKMPPVDTPVEVIIRPFSPEKEKGKEKED